MRGEKWEGNQKGMDQGKREGERRIHVILFLQRINIGERCVNSINHFLELIANEVKALLGVVCNERMHLDDQVCVGREGIGERKGRKRSEGRRGREEREVGGRE